MRWHEAVQPPEDLALIEQQGQVLATRPGKATVLLGGRSGCARCDAGEGCGAGLFGRLLKRRPLELELDDPIPTRSGDAVRVGIGSALLLKLVWRFYGLPLTALLAGIALGHVLAGFAGWPQDPVALAAGVAGAILAWRLARKGSSVISRSELSLLGPVASSTECPMPGSVGRNGSGS